MRLDLQDRKSYNERRMKHLTPILIAGALLCACQQTPPRNIIQMEVPVFTGTAKDSKACCVRTCDERAYYQMTTITGPEAPEWDVFDRADAVIKYNQMPTKDKEMLFEAIAQTYANLPANNKLTSEQINLGIWNDLTKKGVDLSFGKDPADWHPYEMYIHPIVITEMTNFFINAADDSITDEELSLWQKAGCNVVNAHPDNLCMAAMLARKDDLAAGGIIITPDKNGYYKAETRKINWAQYRAEHHK